MPGDHFTSKTPANSVFFPNCFSGRELFLTVQLDFPLFCPQDMGLICHICRTALIKLFLEQKVIFLVWIFLFFFTFWLSHMACRILVSQHGTRDQTYAPCPPERPQKLIVFLFTFFHGVLQSMGRKTLDMTY